MKNGILIRSGRLSLEASDQSGPTASMCFLMPNGARNGFNEVLAATAKRHAGVAACERDDKEVRARSQSPVRVIEANLCPDSGQCV